MKLRGYKLMALMKKDVKMLLCNKNLLFMTMLPVLFAMLYQYLFSSLMEDMGEYLPMGTGFVLSLCTILNLAAIPISCLSMMVAEEKEKNTMRTLMLSDVSATEFLLSKTFVILAAMETAGVAVFFITGTSFDHLLVFLLLNTFTSISVLLFGAIIGLLAKDQMSTGTLSTPFMLLFMLPPFFAKMNTTLEAIAKWIPTYAFNELFMFHLQGNSLFDSSMLMNYAVLLIWIVIGVLGFRYVYKKKGLDN